MVLTESSRSYSINISIPSQNECRKLTVSEHDLIQGIKEKIIRDIKSPEESDNFTNNGLLLVSKKKDLKQFLNDKDEIGDLKKFASDYSLEFVPKYKIPTKEEEKKNVSALNDSDVQKKFIDLINENCDNQVKDILDMGVDPNFVSENGETPVSLCISKNKMEVLKLLLDNGAYIDYKMHKGKNWITYLQYAILCQNFDIVKFLVERGIWIEDKDKKNRTALFYAIKINNIDYVTYLLNLGANIQCLDSKGNLPLHYACKKGNDKIVHYLIDFGSDLNFVDQNGDTPLHIAMKYNHKECVRWLLVRGSRKDLPNNEGQKPVDVNRANQCDEETIKMVESFNYNDIIPPPPKFSLDNKNEKEKINKEKQKLKEKEKLNKKKRTIVVKVPPPPPMFLPPKVISKLSSDSMPSLQRSRSSSTPSIIIGKQYKPKLERAGSNKNIYSTVSGRPSTEPNNRSPLRQQGSIHNIYDGSIYAPYSVSSSPLSKSIELEVSPQTATNPEDRATGALDTPRTAINRNSFSTPYLYGSKDNDDDDQDSNISISNNTSTQNSAHNSISSSLNVLNSNTQLNLNSNPNSTKNSNTQLNLNSNPNSTKNSNTQLNLNSNPNSAKNSNKNLSQDEESPTCREVSIDQKGSNNDINNNNESEELKEKQIRNLPKIKTTKIVLKNLVLSNPNLTTLTDSPRSAIYVPSPRKPSRMLNRNQNFSSASSLLSAFIRNDTSTILDDILNIDNENNDEDNSEDFNEDVDLTKYNYSKESQSEDNPNHELINKEFNTQILNYIQNLSLMGDGEIISMEPQKSRKKQRNPLKIDDKDYQNPQINNKELLLETYEKMYLILSDIQLRSRKAKESIEKTKEEHNELIEEIKIVREKELKAKTNNNKPMTSIV